MRQKGRRCYLLILNYQDRVNNDGRRGRAWRTYAADIRSCLCRSRCRLGNGWSWSSCLDRCLQGWRHTQDTLHINVELQATMTVWCKPSIHSIQNMCINPTLRQTEFKMSLFAAFGLDLQSDVIKVLFCVGAGVSAAVTPPLTVFVNPASTWAKRSRALISVKEGWTGEVASRVTLGYFSRLHSAVAR